MSVHNEIRNLTLVQAKHANKVGFGLAEWGLQQAKVVINKKFNYAQDSLQFLKYAKFQMNYAYLAEDNSGTSKGSICGRFKLCHMTQVLLKLRFTTMERLTG